MPVYEFACDKCGKMFEEFFRSMTERRKPRCPKCGTPKVRKRFSTFAMGGGGRRGGNGGGGGGGGCASCGGGSCATCRH